MSNEADALKTGEVDWERYKRAIGLRDAGQVVEALEQIHELAQAAGNQDEKAILLANEVVCLKLLGRFDDAWERLKQAYALVPKSSSTFPFLGFHEARLLFEQHRGEAALSKTEWLLSHCDNILRLPESRDDYENIQVLRAALLVELNRSSEARPILEEALSYKCQRERAAYYLGLSYFDLGELTSAKQKLEEAVKSGIDGNLKLRTHYKLGIVNFKLGSYAWAKQEFETCLALKEDADPSRRNIYGWLAATCRALRQDDEASKYSKLAE